MAKIKIAYSCGCGFKAEILEEAVKHCNDNQHTLTVNGTIEKDVKGKKREE
jgi:hypothetical protein